MPDLRNNVLFFTPFLPFLFEDVTIFFSMVSVTDRCMLFCMGVGREEDTMKRKKYDDQTSASKRNRLRKYTSRNGEFKD